MFDSVASAEQLLNSAWQIKFLFRWFSPILPASLLKAALASPRMLAFVHGFLLVIRL